MKTLFSIFGVVATFGVLAFAFGYFDMELTDTRRWIGCGLIIAGMAAGWPAIGRLAEDWPRLKPKHDVDLAFIQIGVGVVVLTFACMLGGRFGAFVSPLTEPTGVPLVAPAEQPSRSP